MVETLKNLLVRNKKFDYLETWYAVSANDDTGITLTYFMARSYLFSYAFVWDKKIEIIFLSIITKLVDAVSQMST